MAEWLMQCKTAAQLIGNKPIFCSNSHPYESLLVSGVWEGMTTGQYCCSVPLHVDVGVSEPSSRGVQWGTLY